MPNFCLVAEEMFAFLAEQGVAINEDLRQDAIEVIQRRYPTERAHIAPIDSKKNPARKLKILEASKRLPASVVAERYGVTTGWVIKVNKNR